MAKKRPVSIIVLTHNQLEYTQACFDSIFTTADNFELIVIDNASSDETPEYLRGLESEHRNVRVVNNETNVGFAAGCNQGARMSRYETICLLNNDTVAQPGWLDALRNSLTKGVGIVGARLVFPDMTLQHAGIHFVFREDGPHSYFAAGHRFTGGPADLPDANVVEDVVGVTGACLLTTKPIWNQVDGLDEGYIMANYEDVDYNLKVRDAGYRVIYQPKALLIHFQNTTIKSKSGKPDDPLQFHGRNLSRLNQKWFGKLANGLARPPS